MRDMARRKRRAFIVESLIQWGNILRREKRKAPRPSEERRGGCGIESMFHIIDSRKHLARGFSYEDNKETILDNIRYTPLTLTGQLGTVMLDLNDIYRLQKGDVINMGKTVGSNITLFVGRQPWFTGEMGVYKKNLAVRVKNRIYKEAEDTQEKQEELFGFGQVASSNE